MRTYRDFTITFDPPPIPYRQADWCAVHKDYDGEDDGRIFRGPTEANLIEQIADWYDEQKPDLREVLVEQRGMVQHWIEDHEAGLIPTSQSLNAALAKLDAALGKAEGK